MNYQGMASEQDGTSEYNRMVRVVRSVLDKVVTATLVQVKAIGANGLVDVQPMIAQIDGAGNGTPHGTIHNVPVWRLQGGASGVIVDPAVGDVGLAIFAHNDISSAKATGKPALPGSRRKFDWADAIYLGGILNGQPGQFVRVSGSGIDLVAPTVTASENLLVGNGATGSFSTPTGQVVTVVSGIITGIA